MNKDVPLKRFECTMTTSYDEWKTSYDEKMKAYPSNPTQPLLEFDDVCEQYAKAQKAYMTYPIARFHDTNYIAQTATLQTEEQLMAMSDIGPLYMVYKGYKDDIEAEKTQECFFVHPETLAPMYGMWYPHKAVYVLRFGVRT